MFTSFFASSKSKANVPDETPDKVELVSNPQDPNPPKTCQEIMDECGGDLNVLAMRLIHMSPFNIGLISNPTEDMCFYAIQKNPLAIKKIKNPTDKVCFWIIDNHPKHIHYIQNPSPTVRLLVYSSGLCNLGFSFENDWDGNGYMKQFLVQLPAPVSAKIENNSNTKKENDPITPQSAAVPLRSQRELLYNSELEQRMIRDGFDGSYAIVKADLSVSIVSTEDEAIRYVNENSNSIYRRIGVN